jgi:hypothetical protein
MELRRRLVEHRETLFELLALRAPRAVASPDAFDAPPLCSAARRGADEIRLPGAVHERPVCSPGARDAGVAHCDGAASTASAEGAAGGDLSRHCGSRVRRRGDLRLRAAGDDARRDGLRRGGRPALAERPGAHRSRMDVPRGGTVGADRCAAPQEHATDGALEGGPSDPDDAVRWLEAGVHGRAFVVDGAARWAEPCFDAEWTDGVPAPRAAGPRRECGRARHGPLARARGRRARRRRGLRAFHARPRSLRCAAAPARRGRARHGRGGATRPSVLRDCIRPGRRAHRAGSALHPGRTAGDFVARAPGRDAAGGLRGRGARCGRGRVSGQPDGRRGDRRGVSGHRGGRDPARGPGVGRPSAGASPSSAR